MYIPIWVIVLTLLTAAIAVILWQQGKKPSGWYERVIEVVGKPYVLWVFIGATAVLGAAYWFYLSDIIASVHHMVKHLRTQATGDKIEPENLKNLAQGSALLLGALVAAATLIFTLIRVWINERTTTAEEEGLITDRINAAVASLGAEKTIKKGKDEQTVPNIEVRIGAILALERMAKKNADVHIQIMEILTAYIRENAPVTEGEHDRKPRQDIQLAFTVIGRRPEKRIALERTQKFRLDLNNCDLTHSDGSGLNFAKADFIGTRFVRSQLKNANMENANLWGANMQYADLRRANMQKADLVRASMQQADLRSAILQNAVLRSANMENAALLGANMQYANLWDANMQHAVLSAANMQNANLVNANLQHARHLTDAFLRGAALKSIDFTNIPISQDQLELTFGDGSVILPKSLDRPSHWPHEDLSPTLFRHQWRAWHETLPPDGD